MMTVGNLISILEDYDEDEVIIFKPCNSYYGERISSNIEECDVASFFGEDFKALCLLSDGQCGGVSLN